MYAGAGVIVPDPAVSQGTYLPTVVSVHHESVTSGCAGYPTPSCDAWEAVNGSLQSYYIPDVRYYLVTFKHGFASSINISGSGTRMSGRILDGHGKPVSLCASYETHLLPCPAKVAATLSSGALDTIPMVALLQAAGIAQLDIEGGGVRGGRAGATLRSAGFVLLVNIDYSNVYMTAGHSFGTGHYDEDYIEYTYTVAVGSSLSGSLSVLARPARFSIAASLQHPT